MMMAIGLQGISLKKCEIYKDEKGAYKVSGDYDLMSTAGRVLATQPFGGYSEMTIPLSNESLKALDEFRKALQNDITTILGLGE